MTGPNLFRGRFSLHRYPAGGPANLRAWDAADEYLLDTLADEGLPLAGQRVLLVNDAFGALAVPLAGAGARPVSWHDSHLARLALVANLESNALSPEAVEFLPADVSPAGSFDLVLLKFPKNLTWWQDSLLRLRPCLRPDTRIMGGGMIKHTPRRIFTLMEDCLGPVATGQGRKKARLAFAEFDPARDVPPGVPDREVQVPGLDLVLRNRANLFSRDRLDHGTGLLLAHLPLLQGSADVADLGCGNGVLALALAKRYPAARVLGTDTSYQAVASARDNAVAAGLEVDFRVMDGLVELPDRSRDLVLCNPPFHQDRVIGDNLARRMFKEALRVLRPGGELRIVGNRHLGYHARLTELFGGCRVVAEDKKFVVLSSCALENVSGNNSA